MKRLKNFFKESQGGFTLIEILIVITIIGLLVGIFVVPRVAGVMADGRIITANADIKHLQEAADYFYLDNDEFPNRKDASTARYYTLLFTGMAENATPLAAVKMENQQGADNSQTGVLDIVDWPLVKRDNFYYHFMVNDRFYPAFRERGRGATYGWRESYLKLNGSLLDPWGNSYLVTLKNLGDGTTRIFILSAGPNKVLDTDPAAADIISPDDIGVTFIARL